MSKDFDATLSDALDLAAHAAQTPGPAAARTRGRQRTMRKRIALSTASLALVAVGATTAFQAASAHHGGAPQLIGSRPTTSASGTPTPRSAPTESATTGGATGTPSETAGSRPSTSSPTSPASPGWNTATSTSIDPRQVVTGAWLSASQMPFASTLDWKADRTSSQGSPIGQPLTPTVFYVDKNTGYQALTMCGDPTALLSRTIGAQHTDYQPAAGITQKNNNQASQYIFFFADVTAAQQAYTWLQAQYTASCVANTYGAQLTHVAGDSTEAAWLTLKKTSTNPDMPDYAREYFVLRGSTIAYVSVLSYTQTLATSYDDATVLATIASHSCVYGGSCN